MRPVLDAALPIFALVLTGYLAARLGVLGRAATDGINRFAVFLALPALLFQAMARITPEQIGQAGFALAFGGGIAVTFAVAFALGRRRGRRVADAGIQGLYAAYANVGFMGIPLCLLVFGERGIPPAVIATLFTACLLFEFSIALIELDLRRSGGPGRTARKVLASAIANAENNHNLDVDALVVAEASVGKSITMKRFATRGRGKSTRILKPFSRLRIVVREQEEA